MMDRFEKEYGFIRYNRKTNEVAIVHWSKYNLNKVGGKPIMDCIKKELENVKDKSLLRVILNDVTKEGIRKLFIECIDGVTVEKREVKYEDDFLYEKPSDEQLKRAMDLD